MNSKIQRRPSSPLENEIQLFCLKSGLTPRESQILGLLVEGVVRIKDIAERLTLSPNTVNNHVNSIFLKTQTRSKSQLLANILSSVAEELQWARWFRQSPRLLLVSDGGLADHALFSTARDKGFVLKDARLMRVEHEIAAFAPHFVVLPLEAFETLVTRVRAVSPAILVTWSESLTPAARERAAALGAVDAFAMDSSSEEFMRRMLLSFVERETDREKFREIYFA